MCASGESAENWLSGLVASPSRVVFCRRCCCCLSITLLSAMAREAANAALHCALSYSLSLSSSQQQPVCVCILFFPSTFAVREKNAHTYFARNKERELPSSSPLLLLYLRPSVISDIPPSFTRTKRGPQNIYNNLCRASDAARCCHSQPPNSTACLCFLRLHQIHQTGRRFLFYLNALSLKIN
jgi:hypothetical protein